MMQKNKGHHRHRLFKKKTNTEVTFLSLNFLYFFTRAVKINVLITAINLCTQNHCK